MREEEMDRYELAPSLSEFLKDGGETYLPRPEWCRCFSRDDKHDANGVISMDASTIYPCRESEEPHFQPESMSNSQWERGLILDHSEFSPRIPSPPVSLETPMTEYNLDDNETAEAFARSIYHKVCSSGSNQSPRSVAFDIGKTQNLQDGQMNRTLEVSKVHQDSNENANEDCLFGKDKNSALHLAIKNRRNAAALKLIEYGANPIHRNRNGVTPLMLAAQKGDLDVTIALLEYGANPCESNGHSSALIQACHFGHFDVVKILLEKGALVNQRNQTGTTALMRACQEGHTHIVKLLISYDADVECKNQDGMNALILASRRGHLDVVRSLLQIGCSVNETTAKKSTALMLACKNSHSDVAQNLMTHGAELFMRDCYGRTAVSLAEHNPKMSNLVPFMTIDAQIYFMRKYEACQRSFMFIKMWKLFNEDRASITAVSKTGGGRVRVTCNDMCNETMLCQITSSIEIMARTMALPLPLVGSIASYLPLPILVEKHWEMLQQRRNLDPTSTISCALDLIDDILENSGFLDACDASNLVAPTGYLNWADWRLERLNPKRLDKASKMNWHHPSNPTLRSLPVFGQDFNLGNPLHRYLYALHMRREACYLQMLSHRSRTLTNILVSDYKIPRPLLKRLQNISNIQSLFLRLGTSVIRFNEIVAAEITAVTRDFLNWFMSQANE